MSKVKLFSGSATALITPFHRNEIDYPALGRLIEDQIARHADALVVCGSTGESASLTEKERAEVIAYTVKQVSHRIPVIAGTGAAGTARTLSLSHEACEAGADALLIATPTYCRPPQRGLIAHFEAVANAVSRPIILYNIPSRTGCALTLDSYDRLADHKNIIAVKEAGGSITDAAHFMEICGSRLQLFSGNDDALLPMLAIGASGVISVAGNLIPDVMHRICEMWEAGDVAACQTLTRQIRPLCSLLFSDSNPIPIKAALAIRKQCESTLRPPLCEAEPILIEKLQQEFNRLHTLGLLT